jgi:hypothetical protein
LAQPFERQRVVNGDLGEGQREGHALQHGDRRFSSEILL